MTFASGTATRAEAVALWKACLNLEIALQGFSQGEGVLNVGTRFTAAQIDTLVTAVSAAITAANA